MNEDGEIYSACIKPAHQPYLMEVYSETLGIYGDGLRDGHCGHEFTCYGIL